ncbi:HAD-IA family hydrolase [Psychrobium sp. 1_MG-2023]|uniref:HAD-IA family hydrolase n=1 Tax=Psychrobium sp. 1_MG-2023 TaxID=3062624 RepID=UPI002699200C|nr:HAD-IA family hydrolase [Psychrobium sp. 1_MG-2023]MDP2560139.1 HAD-IA family hydrolase [Psychrobium sp. 1_MG-2023]
MSFSFKFKQHTVNAMLFDLDGTLLDTAADLGAAANALLSRDGLELLSDDTIFHTASQGALALIKAGYGHALSEDDYQRLRQEFLDYYENNVATHSRYFGGCEQLLNQLNDQKIPWGIVTNKPYFYTKQLLNSFPLLATTHVTVCGDTMRERKPSPAPLILAAKSLAIEPQQIIYVGDARTDIEAATSAKMHSVAANYGYIPHQDPCHEWQADMIVDRCDELCDLLTNS